MTEGKRQNIYVKNYQDYYADVVDYSIAVYEKFALHNRCIRPKRMEKAVLSWKEKVARSSLFQ